MNKNQNQIISHVMISIEPGATVEEESVTSLVEAFSVMYPITEDEKAAILPDLPRPP